MLSQGYVLLFYHYVPNFYESFCCPKVMYFCFTIMFLIFMSVELQKISDFLLFLVMKYVSGTAEDQWFSPVPCDEVCQWNCRRSVIFSCSL